MCVSVQNLHFVMKRIFLGSKILRMPFLEQWTTLIELASKKEC
jgi:hypothetical protein